MGLDISAYRKIQKVDAVFNQHGEPIDPVTREELEDVVRFYVNPDFPGRAGDIEDGAVYRTDGARVHVAAGSYGWYSYWRDELAKLAGWPLGSYEQYGRTWPSYSASTYAAESGPFYELICFSDCDGTLCAEVCAKLAKDFADYQDRADAHENERFRIKYNEWRKAFDFAAGGGAMKFH